MTRLIPQHISQLAFISAAIMPIGGIVSYKYGYYSCMIIHFCLYITTILYWNNVDYSRTIRKIDMVMSNLYTINGTYIFLRDLDTKNKILCSISGIGTIIIYFVNDHIFQHQILNPSKNIMNGPYSYFSIQYTLPNSSQRESAYYYSVIVHCVGLHVMPILIVIYALFVNKKSIEYDEI
jgi:hypothetical protein